VKIVADTNTFLAVVLEEPEKDRLIRVTDSHDLVAPAVLPFEIGNALSALARRDLLSFSQLSSVWNAAISIPVELSAVNYRAALLLAGRFKIYAYDAYFLQCALDKKYPLLTLDKGMQRIAKQIGITLLDSL
jgi:predicted nucleic acid-binding protein